MKKYMVFSIFLGLFFFMPYTALAKVSGPCANCHTMHFSQSPWPMGWQAEGPNDYLLVKKGGGAHSSSCVACHSSDTSSTHEDLAGDGTCTVPIVFYFGAAAPTEYLAGGNFWWVKQGLGGDDTKGHNVFLNEGDQHYGPSGGTNNAPGNTIMGCGTNACHQNLSEPFVGADMGYNLPGKYGCEGCHLNVRHHANDHPNGQGGLVTTIDQGWYRFLSGHWTDGVEGYEDAYWEATVSANDHNEYKGSTTSFWLNHHTTTGFCTGCHLDFHTQKSGTSWIRHPSDAVIIQDPVNPGEYADAGGASHLYDPLSPVAKPTVNTPDSTVNPDTDMVMCLSCHRPHGSPYPDMLRWDYTTQQAGGGGEDRGCFYCHTKKND